MKARFALIARLGKGFVTVKIHKGAYLEPEGAPTYYARFTVEKDGKPKRQWKALGTDFAKACQMIGNLEIAQEYTRRGMTPPDQPELEERSIPVKIEEYLASIKEEIAQDQLAASTLKAYRLILGYFAEHTTKRSVDQVKLAEMRAFKKKLFEDKFAKCTVKNRFCVVMSFLKWCKVETGVESDDWPKHDHRDVGFYTPKEQRKLFEAANPDEELILRSFCYSGLRSGELQHLTYEDVTFETPTVFRVRNKPGLWRGKNKNANREVPVPLDIAQAIKYRMIERKAKPTDWVFPNSHGGPDKNLLRIVKRVAKRAGVTGRVDDHKFRSTCASRWMDEGYSIEQVRIWLGHSNYDMIQRYVKSRAASDSKVQEKINAHYERDKAAAATGD